MRLTPEFERTLRRYLLGDLEDAARIQLEEQLVVEPDAFKALGVVEEELTEDYLDGALSEADRRCYESHVLSCSVHRRGLGFARALRRRAATLAPPVGAGDHAARPEGAAAAAWGWLSGLTGHLRPPRWQPAWAAVAAALLLSLAANVWLVLHRPSPGTTTSPARAAARGLEATTPRPRSGVLSVALTAGLLRSGGTLARVAVPADAAVVRLELELTADDYPSYRASLHDPDGAELWAVSKLRPEVAGDRTVVALVVPAATLGGGDYQLKLSGVTARGDREPLASYPFRVTRE
jgi:hypothetical protein